MLSIEEKIQQALKRADFNLKECRLEEKRVRDLKKKEDNRRKFIVGSLVIDAFPELLNITPGTIAENEVRFQNLKQVLKVLSASPEFIKKLTETAALDIAAKKVLSDFSAKLNAQCVGGQVENHVEEQVENHVEEAEL